MTSRGDAASQRRPEGNHRPAPTRKGRRQRSCVYCGARSYGLACAAHRDLVALDPNLAGR